MKKYLFIICVLANIITCGNAIAYTLNQTNDIFYAIRRGDRDRVIDFAKNPYNLERRGGDNRYTPLLLAALCGRWDFVDILLTYGSNTSITNKQGENLLMVSLKASIPYEKFKEYSKLCNINHVDKREKSILHHAANNILCSPDVLFYALEIFPYINYQDSEGITPLLEAVLDGKYTTAKILLDLGADPTIKSKNGKCITDEILHSIKRTSISDIEEQKTNEFKQKNIINYRKITKTDLQENIKISHSQEKKEDDSGNIFNNILLTFKNFVGFTSEKQDKELFAAPEENVASSESSLSDTVMSLIRKIKFSFERLFSPKDSMEQGEELHSWTGPQLNEYPPATISKSEISESRKVHLKGKILCQQVSQDLQALVNESG